MEPIPISSTRPLDRLALRSRLRAAGIHLGLSALVALLSAALVFGLWYPMPFREISGGRELFTLVLAVDVVLGPLITLMVFDRRKSWRELRRDLTVVALLQIAGLIYGLHAVFVARPVVMSLENNRLRVVTAADLDAQMLAEAPPALRSLPLWGVRVVATRPPREDEKMEAIELALAGIDIGQRPNFWLPPEATGAAFLRAAQPLAELQRRRPASAAELQQRAAALGRSINQLRYLPLLARRSDWVALIDAGSGAVVGYAPVDGF